MTIPVLVKQNGDGQVLVLTTRSELRLPIRALFAGGLRVHPEDEKLYSGNLWFKIVWREGGPPLTAEEARSMLEAAGFNATILSD